MPHLDITTYLTQWTWTLISFTILYTLTTYIILPGIADIIKARKAFASKK